MLVDPAFLTVIKDPPAPKKTGPRSKVERKSKAEENTEQQGNDVFEAGPRKRGRKKENRELDRYL